MLRSLRSDIFDIPVPQLGPEQFVAPSAELLRIMSPEMQATVPPAPDTVWGWLNRNQTVILIASALLFGLVLMARVSRR